MLNTAGRCAANSSGNVNVSPWRAFRKRSWILPEASRQPESFRCVQRGIRARDTQRGGAAQRVDDRDQGELLPLDNAETNAGVGLDFLLQALGELLVALGGDDREDVDLGVPHAVARLVDTEPQAAADGLPALDLGAHLPQGEIWKTLGLSQPSFNAECEKMNRSGVAKLNNSSFFRMIRL